MGAFHESYKEQVELLANQMREEAMPKLTEELFALFETTGNRLKYEEVYFRRRKFLAVYGMAAYIFKRREDVQKLEAVLSDICEEECWALPAHVNRKADSNWRYVVDLFSSETAQTLAEIVTLVNGALPAQNRLPETLCERVRAEIRKRVLKPFFQTKWYGGWECSDHNWNAVCAGSIGSACIYLMEKNEKEQLNLYLERLCHSLTFYLGGFREDGACMEGIGYFTYGMTYFIGFAEQLLRYSNGTINLFANEKLRKIAEFQQKTYFSSGQTVSFSDGDKQAKFRMGLTSYLAGQYDTVRIPAEELACDFESDNCYRFMGLMRDYLWTKDNAEVCETECGKESKIVARHDILPEAQWSICESKNRIGFAIKGGDNGEPHNHNDIGSFLYLMAEEQLIMDLGAGEYTKEYFSTGRYEILCNSSRGHSVPQINGGLQKDGRQYKASAFLADGAGTTKIEFAGAYEDGAMKSLTREATFSLEDGCLLITDIVEGLQEQIVITEQLVTQGNVSCKDNNKLCIRGKVSSCEIQFSETPENLRVLEEIHSNHEGEPETVRLVQWDVTFNEKEIVGSTWFRIVPCDLQL